MSTLAIYRVMTLLATPLACMLLKLRCAKGKEDLLRLKERKGIALFSRPPGPLAWLHAASVGEAQSALVLINRLLEGYSGLQILVTTGTVTSAGYLEERLPSGAFHQYLPLDCPHWVSRFLAHWTPDIAFWIESEFWPNLITETVQRNIPAVLVNARMSASAFRAWQRLGSVAFRLVSGFEICLAQNEQQAERLRKLGANNVHSLGNLKYSAEPLGFDAARLESLQNDIGGRSVLVAASTHAGEEVIVSNAHTALLSKVPDLLTIIVPRHPGRALKIETELARRGHQCVRRSTGEKITTDTTIYIADTLGELGLFYRLARIAFIGGSMARHGGHNPLEAAQLGCAIVQGPDMVNFQGVADALLADGGAVTVHDAKDLASVVGQMFEDRELWLERTKAAEMVAKDNSDVIDRVCDVIKPIVMSALRNEIDADA